jgi:hypothetical protein
MNARRVAALLRELADAIEQPVEQPKPKRRPRAAGAPELSVVPSDAMTLRVGRTLRRLGVRP